MCSICAGACCPAFILPPGEYTLGGVNTCAAGAITVTGVLKEESNVVITD